MTPSRFYALHDDHGPMRVYFRERDAKIGMQHLGGYGTGNVRIVEYVPADEIDKLVAALETALVDIKDIVGMSPELDDLRLTLYRFDGVDMDTVKHAHETLRAALDDCRGHAGGDE